MMVFFSYYVHQLHDSYKDWHLIEFQCIVLKVQDLCYCNIKSPGSDNQGSQTSDLHLFVSLQALIYNCFQPFSIPVLIFRIVHVVDYPLLTQSYVWDLFMSKQTFDVKVSLLFFTDDTVILTQKPASNLTFYVGDSKFFINFFGVSTQMWEGSQVCLIYNCFQILEFSPLSINRWQMLLLQCLFYQFDFWPLSIAYFINFDFFHIFISWKCWRKRW